MYFFDKVQSASNDSIFLNKVFTKYQRCKITCNAFWRMSGKWHLRLLRYTYISGWSLLLRFLCRFFLRSSSSAEQSFSFMQHVRSAQLPHAHDLLAVVARN